MIVRRYPHIHVDIVGTAVRTVVVRAFHCGLIIGLATHSDSGLKGAYPEISISTVLLDPI